MVPLFEKTRTEDGEIRYVVTTDVEPQSFVSFEVESYNINSEPTLTVEGTVLMRQTEPPEREDGVILLLRSPDSKTIVIRADGTYTKHSGRYPGRGKICRSMWRES